MGMTMTQKILAAHAGLASVTAGQLIEADLDLVLGNDITSPVAIHEIEKMKVDGVFHKGIGSVAERSFRPHVSCVIPTPDNKYLCAVDNGIDQVLRHDLGATEALEQLLHMLDLVG